MKRIAAVLLTLLLLTACQASPKSAGGEKKTYRIGYMVCNSEKETNHRFQTLTAYLGQQLDANFEMEAIDTTDFLKKVDKLDFTHTNSLIYIMMNRFNGVEVLATEKKDSLGSHSQGVIIALKSSGIDSVADLKGKSMLFGPTLAPTGFMSQIDILQQNGIDPERDLSFYTIPKGSWKHEKVAYGVLFEKFDAGALPIADIENMAADDRISLDDFKIIAKSPIIPYCNFAVTQKVDGEFAKKFQKVILGLTKDTTFQYQGETVKVLDRALVDGFEAAADKDFDIVREMAKRTNMPPYQKF